MISAHLSPRPTRANPKVPNPPLGPSPLTLGIVPVAGASGTSPPIQYAELAEIKEEPSYANTEISTGVTRPTELSDIPIVPFSASSASSSTHLSPTSQNSSKIDKRLRTLVKPLGTSFLENKENDRVSYENLHMDYIAELTSEGYTQENVIRALGIARNDIQMAREILHEFAPKRK